MNNKIKIAISLAIVLTVTVVVVAISRKDAGMPTTPLQTEPTQESNQVLPESKIIIGAKPQENRLERTEVEQVEVNDFYKNSSTVGDSSDVSLKNTEEYEILYLTQFSQFIISIKKAPFEEIKNTAEVTFLNTLGINQEDACKLNVVITTPSFANPEYAGVNYPLSFCN